MKLPLSQWIHRETWTDLRRLFQRMQLGPQLFVLALVCSGISALFEGLTMGLTIPLLDILFRETVPTGTVHVVGSIDLPVPAVIRETKSYLIAYLMGLVLICSTFKALCDAYSALTVLKQVQFFIQRLRNALFERFLGFGKAYFDKTPFGDLSNIVVTYCNTLTSTLMEMNNFLTIALLSVVYLGALLWISWKLTVIGVVVYPFYYLLSVQIRERMRRTSSHYVTVMGRLSQAVNEVLGSIPLILSYGTEAREKKHFVEVSGSVRELDYSMAKKQLFARGIQELYMQYLVIGLALVAYLILVRGEAVSSGSRFLVYFLILRRLASCLSSIGGVQMTLERVSGTVRTLSDVFDDSDKFIIPDGEIVFSGLQRSLTFASADFAYRPDHPVLRGVSFEIKRGEMTAIVGPSGSGKSTIMSLLQRFYDCPPNTIFLDGVDIRRYRMASVREHLAVVSQDIYLFNTTLRENLVYGLKREVPPEELASVIRRTSLEEMVKRLPHGLESRIGDRGVRLSGGEKQRVSIARAMLKRAEILLFDEATSALDTETERLIQAALDELVKTRTVLVVAHRLSTVLHADKIVVIEGGTVVEQGRVKELIAKRGRFYHYYSLQSFDTPRTGTDG